MDESAVFMLVKHVFYKQAQQAFVVAMRNGGAGLECGVRGGGSGIEN